MKKVYKKEKYIRFNLKKIEEGHRKRNKKYDPNRHNRFYSGFDLKKAVLAPKDFRLIDNPEKTLLFFREIRRLKNHSRIKNLRYVKIDLTYVEQIDYATISVLTAISDDLKYKNIFLRGNFPNNEKCKLEMEESGFLNHMYNDKGQKYKRGEKSRLIFFEKGHGTLTRSDSINISELIKDIVEHLTGQKSYSKNLKTLLLEICGNSIEWADTQKKQWLIGAKFKQDKVIITITDVGKGILKTLHRKFDNRLYDFIQLKSDLEILRGAFNKKYGSKSREPNRNRGLPSIKYSLEQNKISKLKIITNNVILHFDNEEESKVFGIGNPRFKGTFYLIELKNENILNLNSINV